MWSSALMVFSWDILEVCGDMEETGLLEVVVVVMFTEVGVRLVV